MLVAVLFLFFLLVLLACMQFAIWITAWTACMAVYWPWSPRLIQAYLQVSPFRSDLKQGGGKAGRAYLGLEKKNCLGIFSCFLRRM